MLLVVNMAIPSKRSECGAGCLRRSRDKGQIVSLVFGGATIVNREFKNLAALQNIQNSKFWVFSYPEVSEATNVEDLTGKSFSLRNTPATEAYGYDSFAEAQDKYISLSSNKCGKTRDKWQPHNSQFLTESDSKFD